MLKSRDIQSYRLFETLSEGLIYFMVVFSPWAFGTTQPWSTWTMNVAGYLLGLLLAAKLAIRWGKHYRAPRWDRAASREPGGEDGGERRAEDGGQSTEDRRRRTDDSEQSPAASRLTTALAGLTLAILGYILVSALNARATFVPEAVSFDYHECIPWLPHSFDSSRTWQSFWDYLALACAFWAIRDWVVGKTDTEARRRRTEDDAHGTDSRRGVVETEADGEGRGTGASHRRWSQDGGQRTENRYKVAQAGTPLPAPNSLLQAPSSLLPASRSLPLASPLPARLRRLLWVLCLNGGLLGVEAIAQRLSNTGKLLWLVQPEIHKTAEGQFGPYAYRSNAAQYFNLVWPVCLGFWWTLNRARSRGAGEGRGQRTEDGGLGAGNGEQRAEGGERRAEDRGQQTEGRSRRAGGGNSRFPASGSLASTLWLLACGIIMAACPIISTTRGGAFVTVGILVMAALFLTATHFLFDHSRHRGGADSRLGAHQTTRLSSGKPRARRRFESLRAWTRQNATVLLVLGFTVGALVLGYELGWKQLGPRLRSAVMEEGFAGREAEYDQARPMARDFPWFGTGPGTFATVFQLYLPAGQEEYWIQVHNDWLETRITFGWVGSALIAAAFLLVLARCFLPGGIHGGRRFIVLLWLALAGCLVHARFDFPFQIYSVLFCFLVLCAVLSVVSRRGA